MLTNLTEIAGISDLVSGIRQLWPTLTPSQEERIFEWLESRSYKKNEIIYRQNSVPHHLLLVMEGSVKVFKDGVGGRNQIIRVVKPVEMFGVRAYFAEEDHSSTAVALEASRIVLIPVDVMVHVMRENPDVCFSIIRHLAIQLGHSDNRTVNLTQKHIRGRLAEALLFLKESRGMEEDGETLGIQMTREDLASLSNMTTSNAIRTLSQFAEEHLVAIDGKKIKLLQLEELANISQSR